MLILKYNHKINMNGLRITNALVPKGTPKCRIMLVYRPVGDLEILCAVTFSQSCPIVLFASAPRWNLLGRSKPAVLSLFAWRVKFGNQMDLVSRTKSIFCITYNYKSGYCRRIDWLVGRTLSTADLGLFLLVFFPT